MSTLDLSEFYDRIKARGETVGRSASNPQDPINPVSLSTLVSARRGHCTNYAATTSPMRRVRVNHNILCKFRVDSEAQLRLLTQSVTA